ncbi:MAG: GntR family transcriptional regulator, partial [Actinomycetota bacterium]
MVEYIQLNRKHLYEQIASQLEEMILNETLKIGDQLPPEKDLAEKFGVSRNILREALKTLKERGLIDVKTGNGIYITKPKPEVIKKILNRLVKLGDVNIKELFEFRLAIEVKACGLAAERATIEEIENLENILNMMKGDSCNLDK